MSRRNQSSKLKISWQHFWRCRWRVLCVFVVLVSASCGVFGKIPSVNALDITNECVDVEFIFARGSGEALENGKSALAWQESIENAISGIDITTRFYNLGERESRGYQYPAVSVSGSFGGTWNMLGAYFSAGESAEFGRSVEQGRGELIYHLIEEMQACSQTKFVLGGYSQGAMILSKTLPKLYAPRILYVATFGDPKIYLPEGEGIFRTPDACRGVNLSPYRENVSDCHAYKGVLGSVQPYQPDNYTGKLGTWCNGLDVMCSSGLSIKDHSGYISEKMYDEAAQIIRGKIKVAFSDRITNSTNDEINLHNLVLMFDKTGSMSRWIRRYKNEALRLARKVYQAGGKVALYTYGEEKEGVKPEEVCGFDCSLEELEDAIGAIVSRNGGDEPESLLPALMKAMDDTPWTLGATKTIVVLTDGTYHQYEQDITVKDVIRRSLEIDPVNVYVLTQEVRKQSYTSLTADTNGKFYTFDDENYEGVFAQATKDIFSRPVAKLKKQSYAGKVGEMFVFDASDSYGFNGGTLKYEWDLNGDGKFVAGGSSVRKIYTEEFSGYIQVRVTDNNGASTMSAKVEVNTDDDLELARITNLETQELEDNKVEVKFETTADEILVAINGDLLGKMEVENERQTLILTDTYDDMEITLVPYREQRRGVAESFTWRATDKDDELPNASDIFKDEGKGLENNGEQGNNSGNSGESSGNHNGDLGNFGSISSDQSELSGNLSQNLTTIPKVPNTGARRKNN